MASLSQYKLPLIRLPEPYKTTYDLQVITIQSGIREFQLRRSPRADEGVPPPQQLHHDSLTFTDLSHPDPASTPAEGNNSAWARAQRSPATNWTWNGDQAPSVAQIWNVIHALLTLQSDFEIFRAVLHGKGKELLAKELQAVGLAISHPSPSAPPGQPIPETPDLTDQLVVHRSTFWQGAGSPFGSRPVWVADAAIYSSLRQPLTSYPLHPVQQTLTTKFPDVRVHALHPVRPAKPTPGTRIYSRYIPHLDEFFSIWALDYTNEEHLQLFHQWQNDPRVAKGWNETGTLEQHREYLRKIHEDPHQITVLAKFNDTFFSYHEIYWAKEDHLGAHYDADDWDRGRHSLVGDTRFRGPHRVMVWWCSIMHYMFLDDPRTKYIVGEPKYTNLTPLAYDHATGFILDRIVDLPHKRSALVKCRREKFFHIAPFRFNGSEELERNPFRSLKL
ncbi:acyl-CoA N-acyltransferase [Aspergillus avenaceus]|uniref:Acyl-CoA N-acyltransferase n=1 Tax=Aspergillus avenaceus TaxID=36643 RepID=A0A5N6TZK0_ASPAV|nr:acyl-CoA N-acyltransferase [Aspergillus avenaceus]